MRTRRLVLRLGAVSAAILALMFGDAPARAQGSDVALRIDCPPLDEASRAALEARARAELSSAPLRGGEVAIDCEGGTAIVSWQPRGESRHESSVGLEPDLAATVEALLGALDTLLFDKRAAGERGEPASPPPVVVPPGPADSRVPPPADAASVRPRAPYGLGLTLGVDSELWRGAVPGAMGAQVGGRLQAPSGWSVTLAGGVLWGLGSAQGLSARTLRVVAGVDLLVVPHVRVGLGADGRMMTVATDGSLGPTALDGTTAGGILTAHYLLKLGTLGLSAGPQAEFLARPLVAAVAGAEVFRVPSVMVGLAVDGEADLVR